MSPKILMVNDIASAGGGKTVMLDVARVLIDAGFQTHLACPHGDLSVEGEELGATWHEFTYSERRLLTHRTGLPRPKAAVSRVREARRLAALARDIGADIVHTGALVPHVDAAFARRRIRAKVVWHINQLHPRLLFAAGLPDRIISVSRAALRPAAWRRTARDRAVVVSNGVDVEVYRPPTADERERMRAMLGLNDAFTIVTIARLEPLKGVDVLIRAVARSRVKATLVVVGDSTGYSGGDTYAASLRHLAAQLGVDARFLGHRDDVSAILHAADLFALASRWDAFGLVLAEASASGLAVVSSDVGGCSEVVVDGTTGALVPVGDEAAFASQFDKLARSVSRRECLGKAGRTHALVAFDKSKLGERLVPLYRALVAAE